MFNLFRKHKKKINHNEQQDSSALHLEISHKDCHYLINPYQQLTCWMLYRLSDVSMGEKMKAALLELKDLLLEFDRINKENHPFSLDNWNSYNIWMDIAVSEYINVYIDDVEEYLFIKRHNPELYVSYHIDFVGFYRLTKEKAPFEEAFPNTQAYKEFERICDKVEIINNFLFLGQYTYGGDNINTFQMYIDDDKIRERGDFYVEDFERIILTEPDIYPTYLVYPKAYKENDKVEITGVYLPNNPLKSIAAYSINSDEFFGSLINNDDLPKLGKPIQQIDGHIEYGLYDPSSPYYDNPANPYDIFSKGFDDWIETDWYYVKEIPPNTEGIPNNPLRLEHLRYPLKEGEKYISLAELKVRDGYVYQNPNAMVEQYYQVVNRYDKFYCDYLLSHGVNEDRLK